jgi:hypothetical protein
MQCEAGAFFIVGKIQSHQFRLRFKPHGMVKEPHFFSLPLMSGVTLKCEKA